MRQKKITLTISAYETKKNISSNSKLHIVPGIAPGRDKEPPRGHDLPPPTDAEEGQAGSDETGRTGEEESVFLSCNTTRTRVFSCGEGSCIPYDLRCNGVSDCANDADEAVRECGE